PLADPAAVADELIGLFRAGIAAPLPVFPEASRSYATAIREARGEEKARSAAQKQPDYPESTAYQSWEEPEAALLFRDRDPQSPFPGAAPESAIDFARAALALFGPLLDHECEA